MKNTVTGVYKYHMTILFATAQHKVNCTEDWDQLISLQISNEYL